MSVVDGAVLGAFGMALLLVAGYFAVMAIRKTWVVAQSMEVALKAVPSAVAAIQELVSVAREFQRELSYLRAVATGQSPNFGEDSAEEGEAPVSSPRVPAPYPAPVFERFAVKPEPADAMMEDTVIIDSTDEEMAEIEKIDNLRRMGLVHDDPDFKPKGVEVEAP
jgi:hypothetical protein